MRIHQSYHLELPSEAGAFSVLSFTVDEELGLPWRAEVLATTSGPAPKRRALLHKDAAFIIENEGLPGRRQWRGILRSVGLRRHSVDETLYRFVIEAKIARLMDSAHSRLFQKKSVPDIIVDMLRRHDISGANFRFKLTRDYPAREYVTQYHETDFNFIRRLCEDEGLWWRYEEGDEDETIAFGDNFEHYVRARRGLPFRPDQGLEADREALRELTVRAAPALARVVLDDYNYRSAGTKLQSVSERGGRLPGLTGEHYQWGTHHKTPEEGALRARIRHEQSLCRRVTAMGRGNVAAFAPGLVFDTDEKQPEAEYGWLLTRVRHRGARDAAYENAFEGTLSDEVFRLETLAERPKIAGTLPARVVNPGGYDYAFLDEMGRYRVRLPFDLDQWSPGGDSRPVRLGKPYAGPDFGQHFPLHEGTEVVLAFVGGDPDRPYIAGAMHDSQNPDHVPDSWNTRNVIRTWANNKLRLEDKEGAEHVKLATEFQKTQLNLGHLVDGAREKRGEGFELRSDGWGALRGGKGLLVSTQAKTKANGGQRDMAEGLAQLRSAAGQFKAQAEMLPEGGSLLPPEAAAYESLADGLADLKKPGLLMDAKGPLALTTPKSFLFRAGRNLGISAGGQLDFMSLKNITMKAIEGVSILAASEGLKLAAAQGELRLEAHDNNLRLTSKDGLTVTSTQGKVRVEAKKEIKLNCAGGAYIILRENGEIELGCPDAIKFKSATYSQQGPDQKPTNLPGFSICSMQAAEAKKDGGLTKL